MKNGFFGLASDPDLPNFLGLDVNAASEQGDCSIITAGEHPLFPGKVTQGTGKGRVNQLINTDDVWEMLLVAS